MKLIRRGIDKKKIDSNDYPFELRRRAEDELKKIYEVTPRSNGELQRLLHEIEVYQIELEMQNEELQLAKEKIEEGLEQYSNLYNFAPVSYLTFNNTGSILNMNQKGAMLINKELSMVKNKKFQLFIEEKDHHVFDNFLNTIFEKKDKQVCEITLLSQTKQPLIVQMEGIFFYSLLRNSSECFVAVIDITEKRKTEESLFMNQKLESLGILAGGIAHDFNNLLSGLFGYIELAKEIANRENQQEISQYLSMTMNAFTRAKSLANQLLTFSKGGTPVKKIISLMPLIKEAALFALAGSNIHAEFKFSHDLSDCNADEAQIYHVINNIIINARQAMPNGGSIHISAENVSAETILPALLSPNPYLLITINDQGCGISKENMTRIFDPYFTTKQFGNGLGLAISYSIILKHNGLITADSEPGKGSTFYIYLPISPISIAKTNTEPPAEIKGKGKVLLMDDEEDLRFVLSQMLNNLGYVTVSAKDGSEALLLFSKALALNEPFDSVILDLTIPGGMGGKDIIQKLLDQDPNIRVFASSGYSNDPVMTYPQQYGFAGCLKKPFTKTELSSVLFH